MRKVSVLLIAVAFVLGGAAGLAQSGGGAKHVMMTLGDLNWTDAPPALPPGAKIAVLEGPLTNPAPFAFRIKFPANYKIPPHWHPPVEHVTVLSGTFYLGIGEKFDAEKLKALPAGSFAFMQPKTPHFVMTREETIIQVHGVGPWGLTYVNPGDDPRKK